MLGRGRRATGIATDDPRGANARASWAAPDAWRLATGLAWGAVTTLAATAVSIWAAPYLQLAAIVMIYLLGVVVISSRFPMTVSVTTAIITVLAFEFVFIPPAYVLSIPDLKSCITCAGMLVVAVVVTGLADQVRRAKEAETEARVAGERERIRNGLLSSLSHDLRTPLATIVGAGKSLFDFGSELDEASRRDLASTIVEEGGRLHRLLTNLIGVTRLEGGHVAIKKTPQSLDETIGVALGRLGERIAARSVRVQVPFETPLVSFDAVLVEQLMINLLENVLAYAPQDSPIDIEVTSDPSQVCLTIADRGPGIAPGDESRIFEKFHRGSGKNVGDGGMGLGLTICRAIAEAHGGTITAQNRKGGGLEVALSLPHAATVPVARPSPSATIEELREA